MAGKRGYKAGTPAQFHFHLKAMQRAYEQMPANLREKFLNSLRLAVQDEDKDDRGEGIQSLDALIKTYGFLVPCITAPR